MADLTRHEGCEHPSVVESRRHPDGSIDGRCEACGENGFPIRDVAHERFVESGEAPRDLTPAEKLVDDVLAAQRAKGRAKYGQGLDHADGHDWPMEALQELADATQYLAAEVVRLRALRVEPEPSGGLTDEQIRAARALCEAATPGPWGSGLVGIWSDADGHGYLVQLEGGGRGEIALTPADRAFIARARTLVPALLDEVERLRAEGQRLAGQVREAFLSGAKWWEFEKTGATMWGSDQNRAYDEAERRYPGEPTPYETALEMDVERLTAERDQHAADSERRYRLAFAAPSVEEGQALATIAQGLAAAARAGVQDDRYREALDALKTHASQRAAAVREAEAVNDRLCRALENCRALAAREHRKSPAWGHVLRFCAEAGVVGSVLRDEANAAPNRSAALNGSGDTPARGES